MRLANNIALLLSLCTNYATITSAYTASLPSCINARLLHRHSTASYPPSIHRLRAGFPLAASTAAATASEGNDTTEQQSDATTTTPLFSWRARQECWRPDVRDVEKISWGMPAKKKRTGSRGVPHRLNEDERRAFDQARRQGYLQVTGSSWRSQRRDAPLLNSYRSLMDARGRPSIVLHKLSPNSSGGVADHADILVVDLSPLRLPMEFELVEQELKKRVLAEFSVDTMETEVDEGVEETDDTTILLLEENDADDDDDDNDEDGWETRPIYQLSPYFISWNVSRQQGKQIGKLLGGLFDNVEEKATKSKKPKGVRPGKNRRHGGYGIG